MKLFHYYSIALLGLFMVVPQGYGRVTNGPGRDSLEMFLECFPFCNDTPKSPTPNPTRSLPQPKAEGAVEDSLEMFLACFPNCNKKLVPSPSLPAPPKTHPRHRHNNYKRSRKTPNKPLIQPEPEPEEMVMMTNARPTQYENDIFWFHLTEAVKSHRFNEVLQLLIDQLESIAPGIKPLLERALGPSGTTAKEIDPSDSNRFEEIPMNDDETPSQSQPARKAIEWYPSSADTDSDSWKTSGGQNGASGQSDPIWRNSGTGWSSSSSSKDSDSWKTNSGAPGQPGRKGTIWWGNTVIFESSTSSSTMQDSNEIKKVKTSQELQEALNTVQSQVTIQLEPDTVYTGPFIISSSVTSVKVRGVPGDLGSKTYITSPTIGFHLTSEAKNWEFDGVDVINAEVGWLVEGTNNHIHGLSQISSFSSGDSFTMSKHVSQGPTIKVTQVGIRILGQDNQISTLTIESDRIGIDIQGSFTSLSTSTLTTIDGTGLVVGSGAKGTTLSTSTITSKNQEAMTISTGSKSGTISTSTFTGRIGVTVGGDRYTVSTSTFMGSSVPLKVDGCQNEFSTTTAIGATFTAKCGNGKNNITNTWK